ncbi:MAG TPA: alpha/beta hydrolase [Gemmatimonadaceae bacterium]|nr:alpha/beta hydrolase [Gemmatimonadaceae bacterium]
MPDADLLRIPAGPGALHVERYGQGGTAFVLLHGFGTSCFLWRHVGPALALAGHTAYAVDLLGYGESDRPYMGDYALSAQAECVARAMVAMRVEHAVVAGVDIGAGVAMRLAVQQADRVAGLALINGVAFEQCPGREVRRLQRGTARHALRIARGILGAAPLVRELLEGNVAHAEHMPPRLVARYLAPYAGSDGMTHLLALARALRVEDVRDLDLGAIRAPTSVIWGDAERWMDSGLPERVQAAIPLSRLTRLSDVGRLVPEEAPETLTRLLLDLCAR